MPPKKPKLRDDELFRMQLKNKIDLDHPLVRLAGLIDWSQIDEGFGRFTRKKGVLDCRRVCWPVCTS
jgi:IS5 family transposase